jgi:hypothetical protein
MRQACPKSVVEQIREQSIETANPRLYGLSDAIKDFDKTLASIPPLEKVVIEHLGLKAWTLPVPHMLKTIQKEVTDIINQSGNPNKIRFEVRKYRDIPVIHGVRIQGRYVMWRFAVGKARIPKDTVGENRSITR